MTPEETGVILGALPTITKPVLDDVDRWVAAKAGTALDVTAFSPTTGQSRQLAADELADVLSLLLEYDHAKKSGADLSAFQERFAELGLNTSLYDVPTRRSRPLYKGKGVGVEHTGHHLKSLLETARDAARSALNMPRTPRLLPWDVKIFVVDDSDMAREVLAFMLRKLDFNVDLFPGADELLKQIDDMQPELPHLILMDLMMPKVNGLEITRELQLGAKGKVPVVIVTGRKMDDTAVAGLRGEPNVKNFLTKPFTDEKLRAVVESSLAVRLD